MRRAPRMIQPRKRVHLPRRRRITEKGIEMLTEEYMEAYDLTPADARDRVLKSLQLARKR